MTFDPDAAGGPDSGVYGLPFTPEQSHVVIIPVPFEATTSYGGGAAEGPAAVLAASRQVDLFDRETGTPYDRGIAMLPISDEIRAWNDKAKSIAAPIVASGGVQSAADERAAATVDAFGDQVNDWVRGTAGGLLDQNKFVATLGGDHSVPFGTIHAHDDRFTGLGILHLDAHADLRDRYEGFHWSHASIFNNVMNEIPKVGRLVQVGVRDMGHAEFEMIERSEGRIVTWFDPDIAEERDRGVPFARIADRIVDGLPHDVYLSWDIDGLDPTLCPHTGTPVPGGLSWNEAMSLLRATVRSGRRIVGLDLCEVSPGETEWDANVGARLLYKMIGFAMMSESGSRS